MNPMPRTTTLRRLLAPALAALLTACGNQPPVPDWQLNAHGAAERASAAYLAGDERVARQEWARARAEVARTGRPELLARLELLRCAAQLASLEGGACPAFEPLRQDATPPERAYADYLAGQSTPEQTALLPAAQRNAAASVQAIAGIADPLSRLVAAGAAVQAGRATPQLLELASDTAAAQGWRRPLLAWLRLRVRQARAAGDESLVGRLERRIAIIESGGAPAVQAPKN
ncbi:MAG: hypothetical protein KGM60_03330 [Comamonadaceae bacterium]|nr:hypothetical protein [Pseudomonadota bacterium]MBS0611100.1 hypothetical protein [Pseudomonadota bacterium]MDE2413769.1 hypothetical protein [Comamonadaceae bacterium]